ncbi:Ig-like domain-containing protein [Paenibacillus daejeonensis]|uniref:Ig-like domain-containing protein n=1 Tax=Paenibacillus daejeonensis TaxID=135193 RepID=UPI00039CAFEF|nr:Ig-like domain-containing protein [Paenibacillus daejeonensis]
MMHALHNRWSLRSWLSAMLVVTLLCLGLPVPAAGAEEKVVGISFDSVPSPFILYVEDDTELLKLWAEVEGSTSLRDVTSEASWTSSKSSTVKVDKGLLTAVSAGSAQITARYKGFTALISVSAEYLYDKVVLTRGGSSAELSDKLDIQLGEELQLDLSALKGSSRTDVTSDAAWSSSSTGVATVDADGTVTLVNPGTVKITGKHKGLSATVTLTVTSPYKSIAISPDRLMEFKVGDSDKELTATAERKTGESIDITNEATWKSGNVNVVTVEKGVLSPVGSGTTSISVTHLGITKTLTVVVRPSHQAMTLSGDKELHLQLQDAPVQIQASVSDTADHSLDITSQAEWTSSNVFVATVSSSGLISPKAAGTARITATYKGLSRDINVTVYGPMKTISVEKTVLDGFVGEDQQLPAVTGITLSGDSQNISKLITWTSSDESIATIADGKWKPVKLGEATLTAALGSRQVKVKVSVHDKPLALQSDIETLSVVTGKEISLPAVTVIYENGEDETVTDRIDWSVSSPNLLVRDDKLRGLIASRVNLTGTYLGKKITFRVTIEEEIVKLTVDPSTLELNPGRSKSIKVTGTYKNGKTVSLGSKMNWSMANEKIATIKGSSVRAVDEGTTLLIGTYQDRSVSVTITVVPKLKKLAISSSSLRVAIGAKESVTVKAEYDTGKIVDVTSSATWTTSNNKVAEVSGGTITTLSKGSATIRARFDGKTVTVRVTVR